MPAPARIAAHRALARIDEGRTASDALATERARLPDERDRGLLSELVIGTLRWRNQIDHLVSRATQREVARLDPQLLSVLRLGVFQLVHLDRIPARAVVSESVELARAARRAHGAGLVNAALRALTRAQVSSWLPPPPSPAAPAAPGPAAEAWRTSALDYLSITLSHPRWLMSRWLARYGFDAAQVWARFNNAPAPFTVRALHAGTRGDLAGHLRDSGFEVDATTYAADGLTLSPASRPLPPELAARIHPQDEASQLVGGLSGAAPGERVLDACAAPGSKTLQILDALAGRGLLVASDARPRRLRLLRSTLARHDLGTPLVQLDLRQGLPFADVFDCVYVDVPCSGLGVVRRDPDVKWRRQETDLATFQRDQIAMLTTAAAGVRRGGRLVYATCSPEPEEDEDVVAAFLSRHGEFAREPLAPDRAAPGYVADLFTPEGCFRTLPFRHGLDAFFCARLARARG